jgi:hypothetical protein
MEIALIIVLGILIVLIVLAFTFDRGYRLGHADGIRANPYRIVEMGWEIHLPGKGTIKLIEESDEGANNA